MYFLADIPGTKGVWSHWTLCVFRGEGAECVRHRDGPRGHLPVEDVWTLPQHHPVSIL